MGSTDIDVMCPGTSEKEVLASQPNGSPLTHISTIHGRMLLAELNVLRTDSRLCDVVFIVGGTRIQGHRLVLSACSSYFKAMFTNEMVESHQKEVTMSDISVDALELLINFCYTGEIKITEENVQSLLPSACLLQLNEVQVVCCEFLKKQLDASNCLGIRAFADTHSCRELLRSANRFTLQNFLEVMSTEEFLLLPLEQLIEIISSEELNVKSEEQVFAAVIKWVRYDLHERRKYLSKILQHVRLPLCPAKFLVSVVSEEPLVKSDAFSRDLVDEAKNYLLLPTERVNMQGPRTRPRKPVHYGEVLFAVGGWCSGDAIASVEQLDPSKPMPVWKTVSPMSKRRCGVGVAVVDDLVYAVGGHDGQSYLNSVERYDPVTNQWLCDVAPTSTCRTSVGVAVLEGYLYAVGGQDGKSCLNVVERYNARRDEWESVAAMGSRRLGVSVSVLNGCLYAVGGSDGQTPLNTVERYDPRVGRWEQVGSMLTRRKHLGTAVFDGHLYAAGGRDDSCELNSAERYNPYTNEWTPVVAMCSRRSGVALAVVNERLYAVGGFDGQTYLKSVEVFDIDANNWRHHGSMTYRRLGGGLGVVKARYDDNRNDYPTLPRGFPTDLC
ncbi:unnamed protein product [Auanema sp. JU1783]|nr:unnamed protein product [Auanema sp. JU1783]